MVEPGVRNQRHRRLCDARQQADLARMVGAQFHNRTAMSASEPQQGEWHADVIVEVAPGDQDPASTVMAHDGAQHGLDRGLAVAAGHRDQRVLIVFPPGSGQCPQGLCSIRYHELWQIDDNRPADQRSGGAVVTRSLYKVMPVVLHTAQRHEQLTRPHATTVQVHAAEPDVGTLRFAADHICRVKQSHANHDATPYPAFLTDDAM